MTAAQLYAGTAVVLFFLGVFGLVFSRSGVRKTLALNLAGAGVFLYLVAAAYNGPDAPPDPVPHGLVLTGIVIAASATALMLFLIATLRSVEEER